MCLDRSAMRSYRAHKGWATRRRREAANEVSHPPFEGGSRSRERSEGSSALERRRDEPRFTQ
jgi:hypothetical protein